MDIVALGRRIRHAPLLRRQEWLWRALQRPYGAVLRRFAARKGILRELNGHPFRLHYDWALIDSDYEQKAFRTLDRLVTAGSTFFDVGASGGYYTLAAARAVGAEGRVVAFEPAPATVEVLRHHLRLNGLEDRVEVVAAAVTDETGTCTFWERGWSTGASLAEGAAASGYDTPPTRIEVSATTLDDFCGARGIRPDAIKIDVEGAEAKVLRGARRFLEGRRGGILLEVHPAALEELGDSEDATLRLLAEAGWECEELERRVEEDDRLETVHYLCRPLRRK